MLDFLDRTRGLFERLSRYATWVGGASLLLAAIMVTIDVLCRKFLGVTMSGSDEISGYVFAASTTWAYSYCLLHRSHIRIDAFYNMLPLPVRAILDVFGVTLLLVYMTVLTRHAWTAFATSYVNDSVAITTLATPQWIPQLFWVAGLIMFSVTLAFVLFHALVALIARNWLLVNRVAGIMSVEDVIEEETAGVDVVLAHKGSKD
ncbi:MAG: TRAP-type C4-dicarboxylate transport system permease small subunit [Gammaproteobacteria bacterium]|jgi:TRAP-type C4-dicarboxylate transport system permease small subunit